MQGIDSVTGGKERESPLAPWHFWGRFFHARIPLLPRRPALVRPPFIIIAAHRQGFGFPDTGNITGKERAAIGNRHGFPGTMTGMAAGFAATISNGAFPVIGLSTGSGYRGITDKHLSKTAGAALSPRGPNGFSPANSVQRKGP